MLSLRSRIILLVVLTLALLLAMLYLLAHQIILKNFERLERDRSVYQMARLQTAVEEELERLASEAAQSAFLYHRESGFSGTPRPQRLSTLAQLVRHSNEAHVFAAVTQQNQVLFPDGSAAHDLALQRELQEYALSSEASMALANDRVTSMVVALLTEPPVLLASAPAIDPNGDVPFFLVARRFDARMCQELAESLGSPARVKLLPSLETAGLTSRQLFGPPLVEVIGDDEIRGHTLLHVNNRSYPYTLQLLENRVVYAQGAYAVRYFAVYLTLAGLVICGLVIVALDKAVLARLSDLRGQIHMIGDPPRLEKRLIDHANDELTVLVEALNAMLANLERSQASLKESEQRYRSVVEGQTEFLSRWLPDGTFTFVNDAYCRFYGGKPQDWIGRKIYDSTTPELAQKIREKIASLTPQNPSGLLEAPVDLGDGIERWHQWNDHAIFDQQGVVIAIQSVGREITQRKQAEAALRASEEKFRTIFQSAPIGIVRSDTEGLIGDANATFLQMIGYRIEELHGRRLSDFGLEGDGHRDAELMREIAEAGPDLVNWSKRYVHRDGHVIFCEVALSVIRNAQGLPLFYLAMIEDVTEEQRALHELAASEERFHMLLASLPDAVWSAAVDGSVIHYVSPAVHRLYGRTAEDFVANPRLWREMVHPEDGPHVDSMTRQLRLRNQIEMEYRIIRADGGVRWMHSTALIHRDDHGRPLRMNGTTRDVTDRRRAEEASRALELKMQQAQKMESLGILAGGVAHDFNNLLAGIMGSAGLVLMDIEEDSPLRRPLEQIEIASQRASELTRQMLEYAGRATRRVEQVDMTALVREMVQLISASISRRATVRLKLEPGPPLIEVDPAQVRQIVMNLVLNASDALEDGSGTITVRTGTMQAEPGYLASTHLTDPLAPGLYVIFEVIDTGVGMDEATCTRLFDPFFTTKMTGRGLGLAAVLGIVRSHRGFIRVDSEKGFGTTMTVGFPVASSTQATPSSPTSSSSGEVRLDGRALLVEDEDQVAYVSTRVLERLGLMVTRAATGREAEAIFSAEPNAFAVVLLDQTLPDTNGHEVLRRMRLLNPGLKVIMMSGFAQDEVLANIVDGTIEGFLQKPFRPSELAGKISTALQAI